MQKEEIEALIDKRFKDFFIPMAEGLRSIAYHLDSVTDDIKKINELSDLIVKNTNNIKDAKELYIKLEDDIESISRKINYLVNRFKPISTEV